MTDIRIYFEKPYTSDSKQCTGAELIRGEYAKEVHLEELSGVLLYPYSEEELSAADRKTMISRGVNLIDAPWENLNGIVQRLQESNPNIKLRKIPEKYIAANEYYRQKNPVYFTDHTRFSTVEALAYALYITGEKELADKITEEFQLNHVKEGVENCECK